MKYIVLISRGAASLPITSPDIITPLEAADTPNMDALAGRGEMGFAGKSPNLTDSNDSAVFEWHNVTLNANDPDAERAVTSALSNGGEYIRFRIDLAAGIGYDESFDQKIKTIECTDEHFIGAIRDYMRDKCEPYRMLIIAESAEHVGNMTCIYTLYDSTRERRAIARFSEREAMAAEIFAEDMSALMRRLTETQGATP